MCQRHNLCFVAKLMTVQQNMICAVEFMKRVGYLYEKYEIHQMVVGIASAGLHYVNILACSMDKVKCRKIVDLDYARIRCDRFI